MVRHQQYGIPRYTIVPMCEEEPTVKVKSHMHWLALNASAFEKEEDPALRSLLCYIEDGTVDESDELVRAIDAKVDALNESDEVMEMVWTWQDEIDLQANIAFEKGEADGEAKLSTLIKKLLAEGRIEDVERMADNADYRAQLLQEFSLA